MSRFAISDSLILTKRPWTKSLAIVVFIISDHFKIIFRGLPKFCRGHLKFCHGPPEIRGSQPSNLLLAIFVNAHVARVDVFLFGDWDRNWRIHLLYFYILS